MNPKQKRIAVITNVSGDSMQQLAAAANDAHVIFEAINFTYVPLTNFNNSVFAQKLLTYDLVYYRTGMRESALDQLTRFCNKNNLPIINGAIKYKNAHRKVQQAVICDEHDISHPETLLIYRASYDEIAAILGPVFVCKPDVGSKGQGVVLVSSAEQLNTVKAQSSPTNKHIAQAYITDATEYRVYTLGNNGVASYKKVPGDSDFRANLHVGGSMTATEPDLIEKLHSFAGYVATCFEADISGCDILFTNGKFVLIELNFQPGWESLKEISGATLSIDTLKYITSKMK